MSDEAPVNIIRGFTGNSDSKPCVKIVSKGTTEHFFMTYHECFCTITDHTHYWRCNDQWYPTNGNGVERMMSDIQRELGLGAAQMIELEQAIADLMMAGG